MTRADRIIQFIERYCVTPEGADVGKPLVLAGFQKDFIRDVYDNPHGTRRAILSIARKNGKSGLIAGLLLAHLVGPEAKQNAQIVSGAMSRDQAALVFNLACKMVQQSAKLAPLVRIIPSGKRLIGLPLNVEYRALAAEGKTAHGLSPVLAILDEIGQVQGPQSDFVDAITTSQGAHAEPLLIAISTQAASDADLLSVWIDDAKTSNDPRIVCRVYEAPKDCDLLDEAAWQAANPALGLFRSKDDLAEQMKQAQRMPSMANSVRNLLLNQRVSTESPFVSAEVWKACGCGLSNTRDCGDSPAFAGLDLSARTDLTAFVVIVQVDGVWQVHPYFWTPKDTLAERARRDRAPYDVWVQQGLLRTCPGSSIRYDQVAQEVAEICADFDIQAIGFDRWRIDVFKAELERLGLDLPLLPIGQGFRDQAPAIDALEAALLNQELVHGNHPVLTWCAANATTTQDPAGNRKFDKSRPTGRIDGMAALANAFAVSGLEHAAQDAGVFFV
ncbi:terminase [Lampropedia cohaerens]|uniref:Terminase n=1 Tax=Lampropedia cohaerens TaxID=1610491 RepID=A0A0U1PWW9_9BURK|nr:terminase TerL endonuclease subunit [Lampropedia cohaerens]KKW66927.1 terminase [Lampropedia cohaerens]